MNIRKIVFYITGTAVCMLCLLTGVFAVRQQHLQQGIAKKILRFHVLAESDSEEDQALKQKVRDAVGGYMQEQLATADSREMSEKIVTEHLEEIVTLAQTVVTQEGYDYEVTARLAEVDFPVKTYGDYTFPAGKYEALEVTIGSGSGHNWWCVMYPNMCFSGSVYEVVEEDAKEALKEVLTKEEYEEVFSSGKVKVEFRYLTFLNELFD